MSKKKNLYHIYKVAKKGEVLLKSYVSKNRMLNYIESTKNYDYILIAIYMGKVVAYQSQQERKTFWEKINERINFW
jgi:hypothetical protein